MNFSQNYTLDTLYFPKILSIFLLFAIFSIFDWSEKYTRQNEPFWAISLNDVSL